MRPHQWKALGPFGAPPAAVASGWMDADWRVDARRCTRCGREELACYGKDGAAKVEVGAPGIRLRDPCVADGRPWP